MSQPAFFFNPNLCTGCAACAIACQVENNRLPTGKGNEPMPWRTIYDRNTENDPGLVSFHLSLACNHCLEPACLQACPARAISKDSLTGAVLIDSKRCIGCGYCSWACPFDAPKFSQAQGVMEKCTFCQPRMVYGGKPACTAACPTGALHIGLFSSEMQETTAGISGFPKTTMKPAMRFLPVRVNQRPKSLLQNNEEIDKQANSLFYTERLRSQHRRGEISLRGEWPLWVLTVTMPLLFAWFAGLEATRHVQHAWLDAGMLAVGFLAMVISTLHLGKPLRAWRALSNVNTSWLSREILFSVAFLVFSGAAFGLARIGTNDFLYRNRLLVQGSLGVVGILALLSIDQVYAVLRTKDEPYSPEELYRPRLQLHSASTLLGGITLAGIFAVHEIKSGELLVMIFAIPGVLAGILQLFLYSNRHAKKEPAIPLKALLRFTRVTAGFALPAILLAANAPLWVAVGFAWVGFMIDRGEFYEGLAKAKPGW